MKILGLNLNHPDSSACLIINEKIITAVEEERFSRIKHHSGFPFQSLLYCLSVANININDVDFITINTNFLSNFFNKIFFSIKNFSSIEKIKKINLKIQITDILKKNFFLKKKIKIKFIDHHNSHIYSSYYLSGFKNCVGLTIDGAGDFCSSVAYQIENNKFKIIKKVYYPHSLGLFYQAMTQFLGFREYGDEYKFMGLASFGNPIYADKIYEIISPFDKKFFFKLNLDYFSFHKSNLTFNFKDNYPFFPDLFSKKLEELLNLKKRDKLNDLKQEHKDLAASVQFVFEEIVYKILSHLKLNSTSENLCLSGGCSLNSKFNGKLIEKKLFKNLYIQPSGSDAGGALGSALYIQSKFFKINRETFENSLLGPSFSNEKVGDVLKNKIIGDNFKINFYENFSDISKIISQLLSEKNIVAWYQDKMEWGPRALGNRSILADPRYSDIQNIINVKTKKREEFRPFAPSVLEEYQDKYFHMNGTSSYYMTNVYRAKKEAIEKAPAIVHVDGTSRVQSVNESTNKKFYNLIKDFFKITNIPILLNTSFNKAEPIVCSPEDAVNCFLNTKIDILAIQNYIVIRKKI